MRKINVLSLFNGMNVCAMATEDRGIEVSKQYISEINPYANKASDLMFPDAIQCGDVRFIERAIRWKYSTISKALNSKYLKVGAKKLLQSLIIRDVVRSGDIDLVTGGFPCQAWSMAGKQLGDKDPRGMLFWTMLGIMKKVREHNPNAHFLIENVKMKKAFEEYITHHTEQALGVVHKILINSNLATAQNRNRYYWTDFPVEQPKDEGITWGDVREHGVNSFYYTEKGLQWLARHSQRKGKALNVWAADAKAQMVEASHYKNYSLQRFFGICDVPSDQCAIASMRGRRININGKRDDYNTSINREQYIEFKYDGKSNCISTVQKDDIVVPFTLPNRIPLDMFFFRYITPRECMRLQSIPEWYIDMLIESGISNTQLYIMTGNAWTMKIISHVLSFMPEII